ncbi:outer membrane protein [Methylocystis echinoides]|uniref:Outer-membrane immunogenic protein n=1 Tax=Methylocystis echinoides TaxID=29468 RepID=A0A9W6GWC0_9HYPH|nr:porin family protein [Methylocystis echinoides]GLI94288.1 outer-membrane immunogenic protein [Methylocystis echinoides]
MKKFALSVAALALSAAGAFAADLPSRKAEPYLPPPPPPPMWTGFYAGLNAGYGFGTNSNTQSIGVGYLPYTGHYWGEGEGLFDASSTLGAGLALSGVGNNSNQNGFIGGGQVGYNYQWGPSFVIGIEADIQGTGIRGSSRTVGVGGDSSLAAYDNEDSDHYTLINSSAAGTTSVHAGVDWMGTVRGRLGYLFTPTMLVYATGGLTYGGVYANVNNYAVASTDIVHYNGDWSGSQGAFSHTFVGGGNKSSTLVGWNVGGGLEWMFMPNWSLKAEAIYWNMGNMTLPTVALAAAPEGCGDYCGPSGSPATAYGATRVNYQGVIARAGVNYHFNWFAPAPVVAKY